MSKAIIDTNVIFSALYKPKSTSGMIIFLAIEGIVNLIAPISVREEILRKLKEKLEFSSEEAQFIVSSLPIDWIEKEIYEDLLTKAKNMIRDESDAPIIALYLATRYPIITGDKDILESNVEAYKPSEYLRKLMDEKVIRKEELKKILGEIEKFV